MKKLTFQEFLNRLDNKTKEEYEFLSEYINSRTNMKFKHLKCGNLFEMTATNFLSGQRCPHCKNERKSNSLKESKSIKTINNLKEKCGTEYALLSEYKGYREELIIQHIICGHTWTSSACKFLERSRCPKCSRKETYINRRKSPEQYEKEFYDVANNEFKLLTPYLNKRTKVKVEHLKCGNIYDVLPLTFTLDKSGCPICNESKGEREVRRILTKYNFKFEEQYKFDDCKNKQSLPFDFAIFNEDGSLKFLIEYQGIQHYKRTGYFKGESKLKYTKQNDKIKKEYCCNNNIQLLEIPYWDFDNIEKIIKNMKETF